jgi:single-strand DNA-binding protein
MMGDLVSASSPCPEFSSLGRGKLKLRGRSALLGVSAADRTRPGNRQVDRTRQRSVAVPECHPSGGAQYAAMITWTSFFSRRPKIRLRSAIAGLSLLSLPVGWLDTYGRRRHVGPWMPKNFPLLVSRAGGDLDRHSSRMRPRRQNSWFRPGHSAALALRTPLAAPALCRLSGHYGKAIATGHSPTRWRKTMRNIAEFTLIGRVGSIKQVGKTVRVTVCANYPVKDDKGQWKDDAHWNEVTIFTKALQSYASEDVSKGDLVHVRGRLRQNSFERDGQRVYTVDLIALELGRLAQASERAAA